jgi:hypothetical protein
MCRSPEAFPDLSHVTFVPIDFSTDSLEKRLIESGMFPFSSLSFFLFPLFYLLCICLALLYIVFRFPLHWPSLSLFFLISSTSLCSTPLFFSFYRSLFVTLLLQAMTQSCPPTSTGRVSRPISSRKRLMRSLPLLEQGQGQEVILGGKQLARDRENLRGDKEKKN